tara:strand:+ start:572 stop:1612 length:1041 start_codon:yes stop_codon:yes gene_type:complete
MFYNSLKTFVKRFPILWKFLVWFKNCLIDLSRLKDVLMMMILLHVWPEQTFRFSTRKFLPSKKNKFSKNSRPTIPYELLKSKSSAIPKMKEINLVGRGSSFDFNNLEKLDGPIFLVGFWDLLQIDNNGNFYTYLPGIGFCSNEGRDWKKISEQVDLRTLKEIQNKNITYICGDKAVLELFKKKGHNALVINSYATDKDGNFYALDKSRFEPSYVNLIDNNQCKLISIVQNIFKPPLLLPNPNFAQTGSFLPCLYSLLFFTEKINVYGWDFFLETSPEKMSYWQLFFNMYKYKTDKARSRSHFEEGLISFYYGYQLSKLPNIKIHGYMGKLGKHEKLIKRIEKVLFN